MSKANEASDAMCEDFFNVLADAVQNYNETVERVEADAYASSRFVHDERVKRIVAALCRDAAIQNPTDCITIHGEQCTCPGMV